MPPDVPGAASLLRTPLDLVCEPWRAALAVGRTPGAFAMLGTWLGGARAVLGGAPITVRGVPEDARGAAAFAALADLPRVPDASDGAGIGGGWVSVLGYPLGRRLEPVGGPPPRPVARPDATLAFHDHVVVCDADGRWWAEALVPDGDPHGARGRLDALVARVRAVADARAEPAAARSGGWTAVPDPAAHAAAVDACVARIAEGDLFQANLCLRLSGALDDGDLLDVFCAAWRRLRPAKAAFVRDPDGRGAVASLSPELYLRRRGREVRSSPIKGTRPRGADPQADAEAEAELLGAEKDRAEHVMIVDLVRNDLGRVCATGSVRVAALAHAREAPGVWHLVSDVDGVLRDDVDDPGLLAATFPPGSVTGAPKVAAMRVVHELESTGREAYCGAVGMVSPVAGLDLNVAIRTFEERDGRLWLGAGGGIVADSVGADEAREAADKASPLLAVLEAVPPRASATAVAAPRRVSPVPDPRPAPEAGVFETLLAVDGDLPRLDAHLARLRASVRALWDRDAPEDAVVAAARGAAREAGPGRWRVRTDVRRGGGHDLVVTAVHGPLPGDGAAGGSVALASVVVPGGFGAHKWADRAAWDALAARSAPALPLVVDLDGSVLETSRASVLVACADGTWATPAADGRLLPGTTVARVVAALRADEETVVERRISLDELPTARAVLLTGALRGVEVGGSLDGVPLAAERDAVGTATRASSAARR